MIYYYILVHQGTSPVLKRKKKLVKKYIIAKITHQTKISVVIIDESEGMNYFKNQLEFLARATRQHNYLI